MTKKDIKEMLIKDGIIKKVQWIASEAYKLSYDNKHVWNVPLELIHEKEDMEKIRKEVIKIYLKEGLSKYSFSPFWDKQFMDGLQKSMGEWYKEQINNFKKEHPEQAKKIELGLTLNKEGNNDK